MLNSSLCDYSDAYILGTITVPNTAGAAVVANNGYKKVILCSFY